MIAVDTSALVAVLLKESDAGTFATSLRRANGIAMSAMSWLEICIVIQSRLGNEGLLSAVDMINDLAIDIVPFDRAQADLALDAFRRFGKGVHPARLNFGDCASYALAKSRNIPLLFKGDDFAHTDVLNLPLSLL